MLPQLAKFKGAALNLLFPPRCVGCGKEGLLLCHSCQLSLPRINPPVCPKCGKPQISGILCPACTVWQSAVDGIRSPLKFDGTAREAIHQFKYKNLRSLAGTLAGFLEAYLKHNSLPGEVLVPVPLHPARLKERGYNQSALLARELGKLIDLPVESACLVRTKYVLPQALTGSVEDRRRNVRQAFSCVNSKLQGLEVLLIDDVSTSGATLDACASALKSSGASAVWGLVLARELPVLTREIS